MWSEYFRRMSRRRWPESSSSSSGRRCRMTSVPRVGLSTVSTVKPPSPVLSQRTPCSAPRPARRVTQRHPVGDDERRVEADAELADEVRILGAVGGQLLEELARARLGDGADVLDHLLPRHADAVVGHGDRARRRVEADADLQVRVVLEERGVGERLEAQLVARHPTRSRPARAGRSPCCRTGSGSSGGGAA